MREPRRFCRLHLSIALSCENNHFGTCGTGHLCVVFWMFQMGYGVPRTACTPAPLSLLCVASGAGGKAKLIIPATSLNHQACSLSSRALDQQCPFLSALNTRAVTSR